MGDAPVAALGVCIDGEVPSRGQAGAESLLLFGERGLEGRELGKPLGMGRTCAVCLRLGVVKHPAGLLVLLFCVFAGAFNVLAVPENASAEQQDQTAFKQFETECSPMQRVQGADHVYSSDGAGVLRVDALSRCAKAMKAASSWGSNCNRMRVPGVAVSPAVFSHANC